MLVIAEAGINHLGNLRVAKEMIDIAKIVGADIFKTQLYDVDSLFPDKKIISQGKNWYEEVKKTQLTKRQVVGLAEYCQSLGLEFMASAFDLERLSWLGEIGVRRHKVASRMNQNREYLETVSRTGKEILLSCRLNYLSPCVLPLSTKFLYCIPQYPAPLTEIHLQDVNFQHYAGFSDHTVGIDAAMVAISRGAQIIEKHFTLDTTLPGPDQICSATPLELKALVDFARKAEEIL